jgi:hypothetical protein
MANTIIGLFSPYRHKIRYYPGPSSKNSYDITEYKDHIRFMEILGGRDGGSGELIPLYFHGAVNYFEELKQLW